MQQSADVHRHNTDVPYIQSDVQTVIHSLASQLGIEEYLLLGEWWAAPYIRNNPIPEQKVSIRNTYSKLRR